MDSTFNSCIQAYKQNTLHNWVIDFLNGEGNNKKLARHIQENDYIFHDLVEYPLENLTRRMGPEESMPFRESMDLWEERINSFANSISGGLKVCPLIATDFWGDIHISDGTHRFEALKKLGYKKYWTIFFIKDPNNKNVVLHSKI